MGNARAEFTVWDRGGLKAGSAENPGVHCSAYFFTGIWVFGYLGEVGGLGWLVQVFSGASEPNKMTQTVISGDFRVRNASRQ